MTSYFTYGYILFMGMCIGSFLNVCIYRIPIGKSVIRPSSACPGCNLDIKWYDNIPVISYILLRGRCRGCKTSISLRYPMVEALTGLFAVTSWAQFGPSPAAGIYFVFIAALLVITFIDIDLGIIPDIISKPGIFIGFAASFLLPGLVWWESLIGIGLGYSSLALIGWVYQRTTGIQGMGQGDFKLLAMIGAFIGWKGVLFTIMAASFTGTAIGLTMMIKDGRGMKMKVPFGPFLAIGAILYIFLGPQIIRWYFNLN